MVPIGVSRYDAPLPSINVRMRLTYALTLSPLSVGNMLNSINTDITTSSCVRLSGGLIKGPHAREIDLLALDREFQFFKPCQVRAKFLLKCSFLGSTPRLASFDKSLPTGA